MCIKCGAIFEMQPSYCNCCDIGHLKSNLANVDTMKEEHLHLRCTSCGFEVIVPTMDNRKYGETY